MMSMSTCWQCKHWDYYGDTDQTGDCEVLSELLGFNPGYSEFSIPNSFGCNKFKQASKTKIEKREKGLRKAIKRQEKWQAEERERNEEYQANLRAMAEATRIANEFKAAHDMKITINDPEDA